jgi:hypothetical protein
VGSKSISHHGKLRSFSGFLPLQTDLVNSLMDSTIQRLRSKSPTSKTVSVTHWQATWNRQRGASQNNQQFHYGDKINLECCPSLTHIVRYYIWSPRAEHFLHYWEQLIFQWAKLFPIHCPLAVFVADCVIRWLMQHKECCTCALWAVLSLGLVLRADWLRALVSNTFFVPWPWAHCFPSPGIRYKSREE